MLFDVEKTLAGIPHDPGVYLMKDARDQIIYIGKAKDLHKRVRQYFDGHDSRAFVSMLENILCRIDVIITSNEREALILEAGLIKRFLPRFNVVLKDDKSMLQLRVDPREQWPRIEIVRRRKKDGAHYYGPYPGAQACRKPLDVIHRHFMMRSCKDSAFKNRIRPCLQYEIHRCPAPCVFEVNHDEYMQNCKAVEMFLAGKYESLEKILNEKMIAASENLEFEQAAVYRDQLRSVQEICESQKIVQKSPVNQDFWAFDGNPDFRAFVVMSVRNGRLVNMQTYDAKDALTSVDDLMCQIMLHHYQCYDEFPNEIILDAQFESIKPLLEETFLEISSKKIVISFPVRGIKADLLETAKTNARQQFTQRRTNDEALLERVKKTLHLSRYPHRIECYDISNLQSGQIVAAMVVFIEGKLDTARCRNFKVKTTQGQDDFGSLNEVLTRRLRYLLPSGESLTKSDDSMDDSQNSEFDDTIDDNDNPGADLDNFDAKNSNNNNENFDTELADKLDDEKIGSKIIESKLDEVISGRASSFCEMPDLLLIDGGHGQVSAVVDAVKSLDMLGKFDIVGIGKSRMKDELDNHEIEHSPERLYYPDLPDPLILDQSCDEILLMAHIRDETHHRAIGFHRRLRESTTMRNRLEDIDGIGPKRKARLLKAFGSIRNISQQSAETIAQTAGISLAHAQKLLEEIQK